MIKEAPSFGRMMAMVVFTMSCFGILLFMWLTFGGSIPLRPEAYRFQASFKEAATLAVEADVRLAGVNVGKVKTKELQKGPARTLVELELKNQFAPIPKDSRAILRQKTLLGETYVEIARAPATTTCPTEGPFRSPRWSRRWSWTRSSGRSTSRLGMRSRSGCGSCRGRSRVVVARI